MDKQVGVYPYFCYNRPDNKKEWAIFTHMCESQKDWAELTSDRKNGSYCIMSHI